MRKILTAITFAISAPVFANGFYVGGQLGMASSNVEESGPSAKQELGVSNAIYGAYAGYQFDLDQAFVAIEADANFGDATATQEAGSIKREGTRSNVYGLHFLAGIPLSKQTDIYARVGAARATFEAKESNGSVSAKSDSDENGLVLGFGMKYRVDDNVGIRLDYRYTKYKEFNFVDGGSDINANDQFFTLGVQYTF